MARDEERITPKGDKKIEHVTVLSSGVVPEITPKPVDNDHRVKGSAVDASDAEDRPVAEPATFGQVLETKVVNDNRTNGRVTMRAGKIISSKDFDLQHLARQGLKIGRHTPNEVRPLDNIFVD